MILSLSALSKELKLTQEERAFIKEHPLIRVQNERTWAPIDFRENGEAKGYSVDYLKLLASKAGFKLKFIPGRAWSTYLKMLKNKKLDIISGMKITPQRQNYAIFTSYPHIELFNAILQRRDSEPLSTLEELKGKRVAVVKGYYQEEVLRLNFPSIEIVYAKDTLEAMHLVLSKQADATIEYHSVFQYNIKRHLLSDLHSIPIKENTHFKKSSQHIGIRSDWPLLKSILDKTMASLNEKESQTLRKKWFSKLRQRQIRLDEDEVSYLQTKKEITFCSTPEWLPIEGIENDKHVGIAADYMKIFSNRLALDFRLVPTESWEQSLLFIKEKKCDFLSSVIPTKEREAFLNFTSHYLNMSLVITTRSDTFFIHSLKNLKHKKVGIINNFAYEKMIRNDHPDVQLVSVDSAYEGMKKVESGEIFAFVDTLETSSEQLRTNSFSDLKISGKLEGKISLSYGVRKDDHALFDILEKGLNSVSEEEKKEIYDKWVFVTVEKTDYSLLWKILAAISIVILFLFYRYKVTLNYNTQLLDVNKKLEKLNLQLEELSQTDQLTKLSNRRHLDTVLHTEVEKLKRHANKLSIILIDIDFFKNINDTYGHPQGDKVLIKMANILRDNSRSIDTIGRWGGEEFLIILAQTDLHQATILAEHLRQKIYEYDFGLEQQITASFGVTEFHSMEDESSLLSRVDSNLYEAKEAGRDKIIAS